MNTNRIRIALLALLSMATIGGALVRAQEEPAESKTPQPPEVFLSAQHAALCKVQVGDPLPEFALPSASQPTDDPIPLADRLGSKATVVAMWRGDGAMAKSMLRDLAEDIVAKYPKPDAKDKKQLDVETMAVAVGAEAGEAAELAQQLGYKGTVLVDKASELYDQVATARLPRVYVLNEAGEIVWMDIEYSLSTRRELKRSIAALAGKPK